jgi:glycosyltransferase involved in cell wall biosynthesis
MTPVVSICMPHLNSQPFTRERMESIVQQTLPDWELIIVDSKSDDGSRELLEEYAGRDPRIRIFEGPRDGIYTNLNRAIERCSGKYIYVATSDDTMRVDCLERMVNALESNPECGICHSCLELIDGNGVTLKSGRAWENWPAQEYFGDWIHQQHIRRAPHDGVLHLGFYTVYSSLTQLLIRRRVFQELGLFRTDCSPHSDFEWGMRVSLLENILHLPLKLATWRRHDRQATSGDSLLRARATGEFPRLARKALEPLTSRNPKLASQLRRSQLNEFYLLDELQGRRDANKSLLARLLAGAGFGLRHPLFSSRWAVHKLRGEKMVGGFDDAVRRELAGMGLTDLLQPVGVAAVVGAVDGQ